MSTSQYFRNSSKVQTGNGVDNIRKLRRRHVEVKYEEPIEKKTKIKKVKNKKEPFEENEDKVSIIENEEKTKWVPQNWQQLLNNIKEMRSDKTAVVDSQGCERTADPNETQEVCIYNSSRF